MKYIEFQLFDTLMKWCQYGLHRLRQACCFSSFDGPRVMVFHDTVFTLYSRLYSRLYNRLHSWLGELYKNERSQAALERSSQDAYDVIRLTRSKTAVWTVDDLAHLIEIRKKIILIYFFLLSVEYGLEG